MGLPISASLRYAVGERKQSSGLQLNANYIRVKSKIADYVHGRARIDDIISQAREASPRLTSLSPPGRPAGGFSIQPLSSKSALGPKSMPPIAESIGTTGRGIPGRQGFDKAGAQKVSVRLKEELKR